MTGGRSAIFRGWRWRAAVPALCMLAACGDATLDVGPFTPTDQCSGSGYGQTSCEPPQGSVSVVYDGQDYTFSPRSVVRFASNFTFEAYIPPASIPLSIEVWAHGPGSYTCEDPSTADRTFVSYGYETIDGGGTCRIDITQFPTTADPRLEGSFSATFNGQQWVTIGDLHAPARTILASGSFSLSNVHIQCTYCP